MVKRLYLGPQAQQEIEHHLTESVISQREIARIAGISQSYISKLLNKRVPFPISVGRRLYAALGLEMPKEGTSDKHWEDLFTSYVNTLRHYYKNTSREEKLKLLTGLEALVQNKDKVE